MNESRPNASVYAAVFLTSAAAIATQVAFTRVFSITLWHHFAYLVIGIALLGFGVAGSYLTTRGIEALGAGTGPDDGTPVEDALVRRALAAGAMTLVAAALCGAVRCNPLELFDDPAVTVSLTFIVVLSALPFFGVGLVIGTALTLYRNRAGSVYAADLLGAGAGGALCTFALGWVGAIGVLFASSAVMAGAGLLLALGVRSRLRGRAAIVFALLAAASGLRGDDDSWIFAAPGKEITYFHLPHYGIENIEHRAWTPHGRIDVSKELQLAIGMGGEFGSVKDLHRPTHYITQDGAAPTALIDMRGKTPEDLEFLFHGTAAAVWNLRGDGRWNDDGTVAPGPKTGANALVIGVGGGIDLLMALAHGASRVTGAEINPEMLRLQELYADFTGHLGEDPRVELVNAEGRAFVRGSRERYDVITLSGVDTFAALASGAYSVAEAYLYSIEAFDDYLDHLTPTGCVQFSRWILDPPRETIRVAHSAAEAMRRRGDDQPWRRILVLKGDKWASIVACNAPIHPHRVDSLRTFAEREGYTIVYAPLRPSHEAFYRLLRGDEDERAAFVREHPYQVEPSTDEVPFFFNYYKWSQLWSMGNLDRDQMLYAPELPIGHGVLLATFLVTALFAVGGILGPLRRLNLGQDPGTRRFLVYFAGLGVAYLFVEIALLQRLTFFLGHPTYALSVVLSALLVSSGLGSLVSRHALTRRLWRVYPWVLAGTIVLGSLVSYFVLPAAIGLPFGQRLVLSLALVVPLGFLMGMPFPAGIERLRDSMPQLVPWAFGTNAFFTVVASALAPMLSMEIGLSALFLVAAIVYIVAFVVGRTRS